MPKPPIQLKRSGTASATPSSLEHGELALNYADSKVFWKNASNTISSFTFQSYALSSHTHAASDITSGTLDAARLPLATTIAAGAVIVGTGLGVSSGTVSVTYGTNSTSACRGDDSRLSDTRTPTDGSVTTAKLANDAVTYAKIQNVSATDRLLGRSSAGSGDVEEITCTAFGRSLIDDADAAAARTTLSVQPTASPAFTGTVTLPSNVNMGSTTGNVIFELGNGATADRFALVDFVGDSTYTDYGLRIGRSNGGANGPSVIVHRGTGELQLSTVEAGGIALATNSTVALTISASQVSTFSGQLLVTAGSGTGPSSYVPGLAVSGDPDTGIQQIGGANTISLVTGGSERVRVDASGNVLIGTTNTDPVGANVEGVVIGPSYVQMSRSGALPLLLNRKSNDGDLAGFWQDGAFEGSISVAGNAVSYNAFCGSHWAQLIDGSLPAILRGTVLETIDEMCEWPDGKSDRLPRVKVSDTPRSRRVYGVFMAWDEDYASTGDMYATALGAYMVRVSGVVQSGDLLESAGDGTARTQPDDIVRSSTIGKVSSTHRVAEYDDGSYLVPCVLMCG